MIWFGCFFLGASLSPRVSKGLKPSVPNQSPAQLLGGAGTASILPGRRCCPEGAALPPRDPGSSDAESTLPFELPVSPLLEDTGQRALGVLALSCNALVFKKHCSW